MRSFDLSDNKFKICLSSEEVASLFGSFEMIDYDTPHTKAIIDSIIINALPEKMLPFDCDKVLIEVFPDGDGCIVEVTKIYGSGKSAKKRRKQEYILLFSSSEDMINYIKSLKPSDILKVKDNTLYRYKNAFFLSVNIRDKSLLINAREYSRVIPVKNPTGEMLLEYGKRLYSGAIEKIFSSL